MNTKKIFVFALASGLALASCKKEKGCTDSAATNYSATAEKDDGSCDYSDPYAATKSAIKTTYANIVLASYQDSKTLAVALKSEIDAFVANPTAQSLEDCKAAWLAAREPYGQTEVYRFGDGPIDDADGPEGALNAWPLDEGYIDYTTSSAASGIINDAATYPTIDASTLESLNEVGGEANISIGYHAIEFLLWGQDDANTSLQTPGQRPYTDYLTTGGTATNQGRRGDYLKACASLLVDHLDLMVNEWSTGGSNYRATFLALDNDVALTKILTGMGTLSKSELAGERIFVALDNQDQEDEHSCFADNTHRDIILNAQGIRNVYLGEYHRIDGTVVTGTSIDDLIGDINAARKSELDMLSALSVSSCNAIPVPFDYSLTQETTGGNGPIMSAINALQDQGDKIAQMGTDFGLTISTDL